MLTRALESESKLEQEALLVREEEIIVGAEDRTSSMIAIYDMQSRLERASTRSSASLSDSFDQFNRQFDFDVDVMNTRVYQLAQRADTRKSAILSGQGTSGHDTLQSQLPINSNIFGAIDDAVKSLEDDAVQNGIENRQLTDHTDNDVGSIHLLRTATRDLTGSNDVPSVPPIPPRYAVNGQHTVLRALETTDGAEPYPSPNPTSPTSPTSSKRAPDSPSDSLSRMFAILNRVNSTTVNNARKASKWAQRRTSPSENAFPKSMHCNALLLGPTSAGKSTAFRSLKFRLTKVSGIRFTPQERRGWLYTIEQNIANAFQHMWQDIKTHPNRVSEQDFERMSGIIEKISNRPSPLYKKGPFPRILTEEHYADLHAFWHHPANEKFRKWQAGGLTPEFDNLDWYGCIYFQPLR